MQEINKKELRQKILTPSQYANISHEKPYKYLLQSKNKKVYFYGAMHSTDKTHVQFTEIPKVIDEFGPDLIIVEQVGHPDRKNKEEINKYEEQIRDKSLEETIQNKAEPGFTQKLAIDSGVDWLSIRPNPNKEFQFYLGKGFKKEEIMVWIFLRTLYQYNRMTKRPNFEEFIKKFLDFLERSTEWDGFDYSYENALKLTENTLEKEIKEENISDIAKILGPVIKGDDNIGIKKVKGIWSESVIYVDYMCLDAIIRSFEKHNAILIVFGSYHAVVMEPALKSLFNNYY